MNNNNNKITSQEKIGKLKFMLENFSNFRFDKKVSDYAKQKLDFINKIVELKQKADNYHKENKEVEKLKTEIDIINLLAEIKKLKEINFNMEDIKNNKDIYDIFDFDMEFEDSHREINNMVKEWFGKADFKDQMRSIFGDDFSNISLSRYSKYIELDDKDIADFNKKINEQQDIKFYINLMKYKNSYDNENKLIAAIKISEDNNKRFDFKTGVKEFKKDLALGITLTTLGSIALLPVALLTVFSAVACIWAALAFVFIPLAAALLAPLTAMMLDGVTGSFSFGSFIVNAATSLFPKVAALFLMSPPLFLASLVIGVPLLAVGIKKTIAANKIETHNLNLKLYRDQRDQLEKSQTKTRDQANKFINKEKSVVKNGKEKDKDGVFDLIKNSSQPDTKKLEDKNVDGKKVLDRVKDKNNRSGKNNNNDKGYVI